MKGTMKPQNRAIERIPPKITAPVASVRSKPKPTRIEVSGWDSPRMAFLTTTISTIALDCAIFPMPNAATEVKMAKRMPAQRAFRARSKTIIGPPDISPRLLMKRYLTARRASEYLVAIPKTPVSHIHKTAPGPPSNTAPATP